MFVSRFSHSPPSPSPLPLRFALQLTTQRFVVSIIIRAPQHHNSTYDARCGNRRMVCMSNYDARCSNYDANYKPICNSLCCFCSIRCIIYINTFATREQFHSQASLFALLGCRRLDHLIGSTSITMCLTCFHVQCPERSM